MRPGCRLVKRTKRRSLSIRSCWRKLRQSKLQLALLLRRTQHPLHRHLMFRQVHRQLPLHPSQPSERLNQAREEEVPLVVMEVLAERALLLELREEEREHLVWALRVKVRVRLEKVHQREEDRRKKGMVLAVSPAVSPVVGMVREQLRWKERIQVRCCHRA